MVFWEQENPILKTGSGAHPVLHQIGSARESDLPSPLPRKCGALLTHPMYILMV